MFGLIVSDYQSIIWQNEISQQRKYTTIDLLEFCLGMVYKKYSVAIPRDPDVILAPFPRF